jgi:glutamine cyclotransferase
MNSYPHDKSAYTQGLIYRDGMLYEGTGLYQQSSLRKVDLQSGEVLQRHDLLPAYFGEGITELGGRLYQLTWKEQIGFIYDLETFERLDDFSYSTEGWGLTQDGKQLIMSDGSNRLQFRDPQDLSVMATQPVLSGDKPVDRLNELEYVDGEVWANIYQTSCIARIDPQSGQVVGWIDIRGLLNPDEMRLAEVPNGIAYDAQGGRIFVTGKLWPRLFEIEILPLP